MKTFETNVIEFITALGAFAALSDSDKAQAEIRGLVYLLWEWVCKYSGIQ